MLQLLLLLLLLQLLLLLKLLLLLLLLQLLQLLPDDFLLDNFQINRFGGNVIKLFFYSSPTKYACLIFQSKARRLTIDSPSLWVRG